MKNQPAAPSPDASKGQSLIIHGTPISPGYAQGIVHCQRILLGPIDVPDTHTEHNVEEEFARLDQATVKISDDLLRLATRVEKEIDSRLAEVFGAHKDILDDRVLKDELRAEIVDNLATAGGAVKSVFLRWEKRFLLMESAIAREKGDDIRDISIRLRNALAGITTHPLENIPQNCVLATTRLLPSDTVFLSNRSTAAVLLRYGSMGSHAALFTRQMGVPCISGIRKIFDTIPQGALALVDAVSGKLTLNPAPETQTDFQQHVDKIAASLSTARANASQVAKTKDGVVIHIGANVGCNEDASKAALNGADGIGLYRLEQFYIGRSRPPSREELFAEMHHTLLPVKGQSVCVRLLDVGADKPLPFLGFMAESNPSLGRRGIRVMRKYPALLNTQLSAILDLQDDFEPRILIPMVALPVDVIVVRKALNKLCAELDISPPKLGAMIETPAAALSAKAIAPYVDFMSFGTNDLTQYAFAADRENAAVEDYFDDSSDVIFRLIEIVHADVPNMPLSICGELAGRNQHISHLLQCGVRSLSVAAPLIPSIKEAIRGISLEVDLAL